MAKLRYISQRDATGCGIACAAMIAESTYSALASRYRTIWPKDRGFRTHVENLRTLLGTKGRRIGPRRRTKDLSRLKQPALVAVRFEKSTGHWHWIIVDPRTKPGTVYDPLSARRRAYPRPLEALRGAWYHTLRQM